MKSAVIKTQKNIKTQDALKSATTAPSTDWNAPLSAIFLHVERLAQVMPQHGCEPYRNRITNLSHCLTPCTLNLEVSWECLYVDFAYKLSQHFGPILSHWFKDIFAYSIVDKSTSLACS